MLKRLNSRLLFFLIVVMSCSYSILIGQSLPKSKNKADKSGKRKGKWVILYNEKWQETKVLDSMVYYRVITYKNDAPVDITKDYYANGKVRFEAVLTADRPKDIKEGNGHYYREDGTKTMTVEYAEGKPQKFVLVDSIQATDYQLISSVVTEFFQNKDYETADSLFLKGFEVAKSADNLDIIYQYYSLYIASLKPVYLSKREFTKPKQVLTEVVSLFKQHKAQHTIKYAEILYQLSGTYTYSGDVVEHKKTLLPLFEEAVYPLKKLRYFDFEFFFEK